jgi:predicted DNA repair protein MutK
VIGFAAERELPIIGRIAAGSLRNKLLILLPLSLALSLFLPWVITPLLMVGGAYLCVEGTEKVLEAVVPHRPDDPGLHSGVTVTSAQALEDERVSSAIKTDFILSAEIMAIALATVSDQSIVTQAVALLLVAVGITAAVYGVVALIVKADDLGVALARRDHRSMPAFIGRAIGRALVRGMPGFLIFLSAIGTAAMVWVGGGIVAHGLETYGLDLLSHAITSAADAAAHLLPFAGGAVKWTVEAFLMGIVGLFVGAAAIAAVRYTLVPGWKLLKRADTSAHDGRHH